MRVLSLSLLVLLLPALTANIGYADPVPCSCLQEMWVDYPGPFDLYFSLDHINSCDDEGEEGLWYGIASNSTLPQICNRNECEDYEGSNDSAMILPGHGQELVGIKAWDLFRVGLESATRKMPGLEFGPPSFVVIPQKSLPAQLKAKHDMIVMAIPINVHVKGSRFDGNTYYFCVQIDSAANQQIDSATFENAKCGRGSQMTLMIRARHGEPHKGLVWLK